MPKEKSSVTTCLKTYVSEFGNIYLQRTIKCCTVCNIKVASDKRFSVTQHIATEKLRRRVQSYKKRTTHFKRFIKIVIQ